MSTKLLQVLKSKLLRSAGCVAAGMLLFNLEAFAQTQISPAPALPPGVQDVVKMHQAGLGEDVLMAQIRNAAATYSLNADQIIYLSKIGVPQTVIHALITSASAVPTATAPVATVPPPPAVMPAPAPIAPPPGDPTVTPGASPDANFDSFHNQLSPYGTWVQAPGYGWCWRPTVAAFDVTWRPYGTGGHWIWTENGWYWESDYPWGGVAFHYGRWVYSNTGWLWVPGYDWAPAWVAWRQTEGYIGWAPLPPGAVFRAGVGLEFGGHVGVDLDFGLPFGAFVFVGYGHFWDHDLHGCFVPHDRAEWLFRRSVIMNGYRYDRGHFFIEGPGRERIGLWTHHEVRFEAPRHDYHDYHDSRGGHFDDHRGFRSDRDHH